jgi:glucokinase
MNLGIEIGGTKLQLGISDGKEPRLARLVRRDIDRGHGAKGILQQIVEAAQPLIQEFRPQRIGFGFGGPVDSIAGTVRKSHQVEGWDGFPIVKWVEENLRLPARLGNDCDVAALAEHRFGAGKGAGDVFYVTVGTGVGGGCVVDGKLLGAGRPSIAEIGHLRPGLHCDDPHDTVESYSAGPGIADYAREVLNFAAKQMLPYSYAPLNFKKFHIYDSDLKDLIQRGGDDLIQINGLTLGVAAKDGNRLAKDLLDRPVQVLGWAIAQVITLLSPEVVVVGGGVSLLGEALFFEPLRTYVKTYVFPQMLDHYRIAPAALGEEAVVHGAIALAATE